MTATLAGHRTTHARLYLSAWGVPWADATLDEEVSLSSSVDLVIADLTVKMSVVSGGPSNGKSKYRLTGGAGGWRRPIAALAYANDAGVKLATVLQDAARAAGETLDASTIPSTRVGPSYVRPADTAWAVLEQLAPENWYVGEDGVTRIGRRTSADLSVTASRGPLDLARGTVTLAAESVASILPGIRVDGLEAVDVLHEVTPTGLRSTIWGAGFTTTNRKLAALRKLVLRVLPDYRFHGTYEYRVVTQEDERLNLQPIRKSLGMPDLRRVVVRPGVAGCRADVALGSRVLVTFVDVDPGRPAVVGFEDAEGEGFVPDRLDLGDGEARVIRSGDLVEVLGPATLANGIAMGVISNHSSVVSEGAPPTGKSRVRA